MNPSSNRAALAAWLAAAEDLLQEQRRHSISPTSVELVTEERDQRRSVALEELEHGLWDLVRRLAMDPGRWILIIEDAASPARYVQLLAYEDGSLVAETASNHFLEHDARWTPEDEATLGQLGWSRPEPPGRSNWRKVCATRSPSLTKITRLVTATLRQVFSLGDRDPVVIELFSSPNRGGTPASELPVSTADSPTDLERPEQTSSRVAPLDTSDWETEPWFDYYRTLYPGAARPRSNFDRWKLATTAVNITRTLWESRERAVSLWRDHHGDDAGQWPIAHPPVVLWSPYVAHGACLACTWISGHAGSDLRRAGRSARQHSASKGSDPAVVRALRVPVSEREGPNDEPLDTKWV